MSSKPKDFKLGLFVVAALAILLAGVFIFGASKLFEGRTVMETYVKEGVEGLKVGAPVLLRGVPVGEVTAINFTWNVYHVAEPRYVVVDFSVGKNASLVEPGHGFAERMKHEIANGLRARVKSQGLAGATILSLEYVNPEQYPPLPTQWEPRHIYVPSAPGQFSEIFKAVTAITHNIGKVDIQGIAGQVQKDLLAVQELLGHFEKIDAAGIGTNVNALVTDLRGVSGNLQEVSAGLEAFVGHTNQLANANLPKISTNADQAVTDAKQLILKLATTTDRLDRMLSGLDLAALNQSLENIRRASQDLQATVRQLRQYPSGALFGKPPPPARSVERP